MVPSPLLNEGKFDLVVAYSTDSEEEMAEAIVNAFHAADIDVFDEPTKLADWVSADLLEGPQWFSDRPLYLCTRIWNHRVVLTPEEIRIYASPALV